MSQLETHSPVAWREKVDSCYEIVSRYLGALRHLQLLSSKRWIDAPEIKQVVDTLKSSQQSVIKFAELKALFEFSRKELDGLRAGRESPKCVPIWGMLYLHRTAIDYWISLGLPADSEVHEIDTAKLQEWAELEKSCLLRDIEAFLRLHQIEEEETDYPELTELRTPAQRLSVGCGRIWKAYKETQEQVERSGKDWQVKKSEAYPEAKKLMESLTLEEFEHYANEGIRRGKRARFEEWVHGSKGKKIPIENFFA